METILAIAAVAVAYRLSAPARDRYGLTWRGHGVLTVLTGLPIMGALVTLYDALTAWP